LETELNLPAGATLADTLGELKRCGCVRAHVGIFDLMGTFRERRLRIDDVANVMDGAGTFVNVLPQWNAGEQLIGPGPFIGESVAIDPQSVRPYPFEENTCLLVADYTGASSAQSPKRLLQSQIDKADDMGFHVQASFESEFIVLKEDAISLRESGFSRLDTFAPDNRCWSGDSAATHAEFVSSLEKTLQDGGLNLMALGPELGAGCFESTLQHTTAMRAAEDHLFLKLFVKAFCRQRGLTASFMSQLGSGFPGLSQHPHVSIIDKSTGKNAFVDAAPSGVDMSDVFKHFVAGMVTLIPEAMALTHHTPNAWRRLAPGNWAPKSASWARQNYSSAIRVITSHAEHCRLEFRLPGADCNPLLNLGFILGAGLWGIETKAVLPAEFTGGSPDEIPQEAHALAHDLYTAAQRLSNSDVSKSIWGVEFIDHFVNAILSEESAIRAETSSAERARYLETV